MVWRAQNTGEVTRVTNCARPVEFSHADAEVSDQLVVGRLSPEAHSARTIGNGDRLPAALTHESPSRRHHRGRGFLVLLPSHAGRYTASGGFLAGQPPSTRRPGSISHNSAPRPAHCVPAPFIPRASVVRTYSLNLGSASSLHGPVRCSAEGSSEHCCPLHAPAAAMRNPRGRRSFKLPLTALAYHHPWTQLGTAYTTSWPSPSVWTSTPGRWGFHAG